MTPAPGTEEAAGEKKTAVPPPHPLFRYDLYPIFRDVVVLMSFHLATGVTFITVNIYILGDKNGMV